MAEKAGRTAAEDYSSSIQSCCDRASKVVDRMDILVSSGQAISGEEVEQLRREINSIKSATAPVG